MNAYLNLETSPQVTKLYDHDDIIFGRNNKFAIQEAKPDEDVALEERCVFGLIPGG